jgi:hypothetical protein
MNKDCLLMLIIVLYMEELLLLENGYLELHIIEEPVVQKVEVMCFSIFD